MEDLNSSLCSQEPIYVYVLSMDGPGEERVCLQGDMSDICSSGKPFDNDLAQQDVSSGVMHRHRPPVFAMQKGASAPIIASLPDLTFANHNNELSIPLNVSSNINISMVMTQEQQQRQQQQQQNNNHKTEIYLEPPPSQPLHHTILRSLSHDAYPKENRNSLPRSLSNENRNSLPRSLSNENRNSLPRSLSNENRHSLQRSLSNASSDRSGPSTPDSPLILPKALLFSKFNKAESDIDRDSLLMSSSLDDSQDSRSLTSYSTGSSGNPDVDSACSMDGDRESLTTERVAVISEGSSVLMLQVSCDHESTTQNGAFLVMVTAIAKACLHYFKKKEADNASMNATQIGQLVTSDRLQVKEHIEAFNKEFSEHVTVVKAAGRRNNDRQFVGTFLNDPVKKEGKCQIGKSGVILCLRKLNKISPAAEFSDQLCHHIISIKPEVLGKPDLPKPDHVKRKEKKFNKTQSKELMSQQFLYDPTITVTEAARRSFVEIADYILFG